MLSKVFVSAISYRRKVNLAIRIAFEFNVQVTIFLVSVIVLMRRMINITSMTLILFPTLLASDIHKLKNDSFADCELGTVDYFSDLSLLFLYSPIVIIAFFYTR